MNSVIKILQKEVLYRDTEKNANFIVTDSRKHSFNIIQLTFVTPEPEVINGTQFPSEPQTNMLHVDYVTNERSRDRFHR